MADSNKKQSVFTSPPVIGAMITGAVTIIVTVITLSFQISSISGPQVVVTATPETEPDVVLVTDTPATNIPSENTASTISTDEDANTSESTIAPTATTVPPTSTPSPEASPNLTLLYDDAAFTVHNISDTPLDLSNMRFSSDTRSWDSTQWGANLVSNLPANNCLRMRDASSGNRQPPAVCGDLYAFVTVGGSALFWLEGATFDVIYNGETIATCDSNATACDVTLP